VTEGILEQPTYGTENDRAAALRRKYYAGESLREMGVLVLLFLPLETVLQKPRFWLEVSALSVLVGFALVILGIKFQVEADVGAESTRE